MDNIKDKIINECLNFLDKKETKEHFKKLMEPVVHDALKELYPYIFLSIIFVIISFLLILGIFVLLMRNKNIFNITKIKK
jgi:hypothetical protein